MGEKMANPGVRIFLCGVIKNPSLHYQIIELLHSIIIRSL